MELKGKSVVLQNVKDEDLDLIYRQSLRRISSYFLFDERFGPRSREDILFEWQTWKDNIFLIMAKGKHPIGVAKMGFVTPYDREASFSISIFKPDLVLSPYAVEAGRIIINNFFSNPDIVRIMTKALSFEKPLMDLFIKLGFKNEGELRDHYYLKRKYYGLVVFGILREEYSEQNG